VKRLRNFLCLMIILFSSFVIIACKNETTNDEVNVSFATLQNIVEESQDISTWQGLSVKTVNSSNAVISSFISNKSTARVSNDQVDFIHEKGNHKIYCEDGVRYYYEDARKYLDESEFDYSEYEAELLSECLNEVEQFFADDKNTDNLLNSSKLDKEDNIEYIFEIQLDKTTNKKLVATYICDKHNKLIMIKVSIVSNNGDKVDTEIKENLEIINSPEWFDSNDYKTNLTYEETTEYVMDISGYENWNGAEIFFPKGLMTAEEATTYWVDIDKGYYVSTNELYKDFSDGENVYRYNSLGNPEFKHDIATATHYYGKMYQPQQLINFCIETYQQFFGVASDYKEYYVASKKYEKEIDIISFKFVMEDDNSYNDVICSIYYDLNKAVEKVDFFTSYKDGNPDHEYEYHITMERIEGIEKPEWFDETDFANFLNYSEMDTMLDNVNMSNWLGYDYKAEISLKDSQFVSDGVHFSENTSIRTKVDNNKIYYDYVTDIYVSEEAKEDFHKLKDEYGSSFDGYSFWRHSEIKNQKIYAIDKVKYSYLENEQPISSQFASNEVGYVPNLFGENLYRVVSEIFKGTAVGSFAVSGMNITNMSNNLILPGEKCYFMTCIKEETNNGTKYIIDYNPIREDSQAKLTIEIYLDDNNSFYQAVINSNYIVSAKDAITKIEITKNENPLTMPEWLEVSDFTNTVTYSYVVGDKNLVTLFNSSIKTLDYLDYSKLDTLPDVLDDIKDYFIGWQIVGTNTLVDKDYLVIEDITLEPKFTHNQIGIVNIVSGSMEPTLKIRESYFYIGQNEYHVDDILVMNCGGVILTHRIIEITYENGVKEYITKGDNSNVVDGVCPEERILGKIVCKIEAKDSYTPNFTDSASLSYIEVRSIFIDENIFNHFNGIEEFVPASLNGTAGASANMKFIKSDDGELIYCGEQENQFKIWCDGECEYYYYFNGETYKETDKTKFIAADITFEEYLEFTKEFFGFYYLTNTFLFGCDFSANRIVNGDLTTINLKILQNEYELNYVLQYNKGILFAMSYSETIQGETATAIMNAIESIEAPEWFNPEDFE